MAHGMDGQNTVQMPLPLVCVAFNPFKLCWVCLLQAEGLSLCGDRPFLPKMSCWVILSSFRGLLLILTLSQASLAALKMVEKIRSFSG